MVVCRIILHEASSQAMMASRVVGSIVTFGKALPCSILYSNSRISRYTPHKVCATSTYSKRLMHNPHHAILFFFLPAHKDCRFVKRRRLMLPAYAYNPHSFPVPLPLNAIPVFNHSKLLCSNQTRMVCIVISSCVDVGVVELIAPVAPWTSCARAKVAKAARQSAESHAHRMPGILSRVR